MSFLTDVCSIQYGYPFDSALFNSNDGTPLVRIRDVVPGFSNTYTTEKCDECYYVENDDMLIGMDGEFNIAYWKGGHAYLNQRVCKIIPKEGVHKRYLFYQLMPILKRIENRTAFVTVKHLSAKELNKIELSLPDFPRQQRIADTLDKVSEGIGLCRKMLGKLDLMVKAKFGEMFGNIPETEFVTMGSVCSLITDGTHQPPKFVDSGIPFLFVSNITTNMLTYNAEKFISAETYAELMKRTPVEIGDILLSTVGSYGHPAIVKSNKQFSFQRHIAFLKPRHNIIDSTFLHSTILTAGVQRQIEAKVKGIAQKTLNLSEIRTLRFPLPPLQEQERYAALVKNINKSKLTIQEIRDKMETEKLALMQEYFG